MKTIKILHLYYDLLNMYGENGNMRSIVKALEQQQIKVIVDFKSIDDKIIMKDYDLIYIGTGTDENYELAKNDLKQYQNDLKEFINDNRFIIATGNALDLFSDLKILNFQTKKLDFRIIGEQIYYVKSLDKIVIGFQNRDRVIINNQEKTLFEVNKGTGLDININKEGILHNNFYGTYLLGPVLIRNPYLLNYLVKKILEYKKYDYIKVKKDISYTAYDEFLKNFVYKNE
jgi:lipid II isoglutaminyl synthase (glutamine-hydrolysing)